MKEKIPCMRELKRELLFFLDDHVRVQYYIEGKNPLKFRKMRQNIEELVIVRA